MWRPSLFWRRHTCKAAPHFDDTSGWTVVLAHYTIGSYGFCRDFITGKYILCWTFAFVETSARLQSGYSSGSELSWESECQSAAVLKSICQYELEDGSHRETLFPVGHLQLYSRTLQVLIPTAMGVTAPFFSVRTGTSLCFGRLQCCSQVAPALMCALVMLVKHCKGSGGTRAVPWRVFTWCSLKSLYVCSHYCVPLARIFPHLLFLMSMRFLQRHCWMYSGMSIQSFKTSWAKLAAPVNPRRSAECSSTAK